MTDFSSHDKQECFIQDSFDDIDSKNIRLPLPHQLPFNIYQQLPPNELRNIARPQNMAARTLSINRRMNLLPDILNNECEQLCTISIQGTIRLRISNREKLTIEEYFSRKSYRQVYNKLNSFPCESRNFTGKLLSIDSVADYNHKMFRELQRQAHESKPNTEDEIDADFECGNLCRAFVEISQPNEYFLFIQNDTNTYGYNIWFFFRFRNLKKGTRTFHLINMIKKTDNYKKGLQISIFSLNKYSKNKTMWFKGTDKINLAQTNFARLSHLTDRYYSLSFQYNFEEDHDEVYFAMNQPYTYTRMIKYISSLEKKAQLKSIHVDIKRIGHTLADNVIPLVRIWTGTLQNKETILLTARQHPCETVSSFVCQGMINQIIMEVPQTKLLLEKYQIVIVPMVNPDGVIHGSSRCNLSGLDLNRQWSQFLIKQFTPETHRIKKYLLQVHKQNPIRYFFDLHGHGKKLNSFVFSCKKGDNPSSRIIELVMNKIEPRFNILDCTYGIERDKQNTLRSQLHQIGIGHCYTLETSLMGYTTPKGQVKQFTEKDLFTIGGSVWKGILTLDRPSEIVFKTLGFTKQQLLQNSQIVIAKICEKQKDQNKKSLADDNASDSDPEGDILDINERLEKCYKNNINLKKKITENIKKQKVKRKKHSVKASAKKSEKKHSSNSQSQEPQKNLTAIKLQYSIQKPIKLQQAVNMAQQQKNMNKISVNNKRTTVYSRKVKEKKQQLKNQEKSNKGQELPSKNSMSKNNDSLNKTETKFRNNQLRTEMLKNQSNTSKTSCSVIYQYPHDGMFNTKRKNNQRIKTEGDTESKKNIPGIFYHEPESRNQTKYSQLREESLKTLLTDTFSVLKIKPKLSIKRYAKPLPHEKIKKFTKLITEERQSDLHQSFSRKKNEFSSKKRLKSLIHVDYANISQRSDNKFYGQLAKNQHNVTKYGANDFKYKRFESFVYNGVTAVNSDRLHSSVFYYFPVL